MGTTESILGHASGSISDDFYGPGSEGAIQEFLRQMAKQYRTAIIYSFDLGRAVYESFH